MIEITINEQYKLRDDGRQFILLEFQPQGVVVKNTRTGKTTERKSGWFGTGGYFQSLPYAVKCVARKAASSEGDCSLGEYIARLEKFEKIIEESVGKHRKYN